MSRDIHAAAPSAYLIVNADDFGYFDRVCEGIIHCAEAGVVTATGIMANGPSFEKWIDRLNGIPKLSAGVHLNATLGRPLTRAMQKELRTRDQEFPSWTGLAASVLSGRIRSEIIIEEWKAQIQRCLDSGVRIEFLNSHEHVHLLPVLFRGAIELAREFDIDQVRVPRAEWGPSFSSDSMIRNLAVSSLRAISRADNQRAPTLLGLNISGRLDVEYLSWRVARLGGGEVFELMCHPGWHDSKAAEKEKLREYHDWELELESLTSPKFTELLQEHGVALVSYEDLRGLRQWQT